MKRNLGVHMNRGDSILRNLLGIISSSSTNNIKFHNFIFGLLKTITFFIYLSKINNDEAIIDIHVTIGINSATRRESLILTKQCICKYCPPLPRAVIQLMLHNVSKNLSDLRKRLDLPTISMVDANRLHSLTCLTTPRVI